MPAEDLRQRGGVQNPVEPGRPLLRPNPHHPISAFRGIQASIDQNFKDGPGEERCNRSTSMRRKPPVRACRPCSSRPRGRRLPARPARGAPDGAGRGAAEASLRGAEEQGPGLGGFRRAAAARRAGRLRALIGPCPRPAPCASSSTPTCSSGWVWRAPADVKASRRWTISGD